MNRFSEEVTKILTHAGWYQDRNVIDDLEIASKFTLFPRAQEVLAEFGGLRFVSPDPGPYAKNEVPIDPNIANYSERRIRSYQALLNIKLFPLGGFGDSDGYIIIDEEGRIYVLPIVSGKLVPLAQSFSDALELLLLNKRLSRQQIAAIWPEPAASEAATKYAIIYNKWGTPSFEHNSEGGESLGTE
jgi:hypothetical protein